MFSLSLYSLFIFIECKLVIAPIVWYKWLEMCMSKYGYLNGNTVLHNINEKNRAQLGSLCLFFRVYVEKKKNKKKILIMVIFWTIEIDLVSKSTLNFVKVQKSGFVRIIN